MEGRHGCIQLGKFVLEFLRSGSSHMTKSPQVINSESSLMVPEGIIHPACTFSHCLLRPADLLVASARLRWLEGEGGHPVTVSAPSKIDQSKNSPELPAEAITIQ